MVKLVTPQISPGVRPAGQVSTGIADQLGRASDAAGMAADTFSQYYEEKAAINNERILAETQAEFQRRYNETAKDAGDGYARDFLAGYESYVAERMAEAPERGRDRLTLALDKYGIQLETQALKAEAAARARAAARAKAEANAAAADARRMRGNALVSDPSLLEDAIAQDPDGADYYSKIALSGRMTYEPDVVRAELFRGEWDANLTPSEKSSFIKQGEAAIARMEREAEQAAIVEQKAIQDDIANDLAYASVNDGAVPVNSPVTDERIDAAFPAEQAAEVKRMYREAQKDAMVLANVNSASDETIAKWVQDMQADLADPANTEIDRKRAERLYSSINQRNTELREDPAGFAVRNSPPLQSVLGIYQEAEDKEKAATTYVDMVQYEFKRRGVSNAPLLPKDVSKGLVAQFNEAAPDVVTQQLREFRQTWGDAAPIIMQQLFDDGLAPEYAVAARVWDDPGLAAEVASLRGQDATELRRGVLKDDLTVIGNNLPNALADYQDAFEAGDITGAATATFNANYSVAERLAMRYVRSGMDASDAVRRVVERLFPETPINEPDAHVLLPVGADEDSVRAAMDDGKTIDALRAWGPEPLDDPALPEFADLEEFLFAAEDTGVWVNNSTGDGVVLTIDVGGYMLPIRNAAGEEYGFKFVDAPSISFGQRIGRKLKPAADALRYIGAVQ